MMLAVVINACVYYDNNNVCLLKPHTYILNTRIKIADTNIYIYMYKYLLGYNKIKIYRVLFEDHRSKNILYILLYSKYKKCPRNDY